MRRALVLVAVAGCGRGGKPPPPNLPAAATALERAAGRMDDSEGRSERVWSVLHGKDVARDLLANEAVGLHWLSGHGFLTSSLGTWGGLVEWGSSTNDSVLAKQDRPNALLRCDGAACAVDDVDHAWQAVAADPECEWIADVGRYEVAGLERGTHRYAVLTAVRNDKDTQGLPPGTWQLGIRLLHGERDAPAFAFAPQVVADATAGVLGPVTSHKGCAIVSWHGDLRSVTIKSEDRSFKLLPPGGFVRLTPGSDDQLHVDTK